jgi:hypothetical protein
VAITDHGNIYGAVHFFEAAKAKGVKRPAANNCPFPFINPLLFVIPTGAKRRGGICGAPFGCPTFTVLHHFLLCHLGEADRTVPSFPNTRN